MSYLVGVDPGLGNCGYSIMKDNKLITYGCQTITNESSLHIQAYKFIQSICICKPDIVCIEGFIGRGQTPELIGCIKLYCDQNNIPYYQFYAHEIKRTITGNAHASKTQIINKVNELFNLNLKYATSGIHKQDTHKADSIAIAWSYQHLLEKGLLKL